MKPILTTLAAIVLFSTASFSQSTPKYSNEFLSIGVGARALGMSNSYVASTDDVTSGFWNPAGLVRQKDKLQLSFMHSAYFSGIANYDYIGLGALVKDKAAIGFSMVRFGIDNIPNTLDLFQNGQINYDRVTSFSAVDYGFFFSYAQKTSIEGLNFGGSAKIVHRRAGEFATAWGFGVDVGMQYMTPGNWTFAVMGKDITSTFNAWKYNFTAAQKDILEQTNNEIPVNSLEITLPKILFGVAKRFEIGEDYSIRGEFDIDMNTDGRRNTLLKTDFVSFDPHMGIEAGYNDIIFVRAGVGNIQEVRNLEYKKEWIAQPNIGVGLNLKRIAVDYALSDVGSGGVAQYSHVFSIRASINPEN
ncbi:PorV/PorQ family protein [bacterium]|nr:PorV/PorQ family protein [bacterium]